jgi:multidrug efflux pump subunit AcrB
MFLADVCAKGSNFATMLIMACVVAGWFSYDRLGLGLLPRSAARRAVFCSPRW